MHRFLIVALSFHGVVLERYWLIREATMWRVRAELQRDRSVEAIQVIELDKEQERKSA